MEPFRIPIFPLGTPILFPQQHVPLYVFEPRYRQMTRDALEGDGRIGMVTVHPDGIPHMSGDPPVFPIGCEGHISASRAEPDGSYHMTLTGVQRFRILEEPPRPASQLYRVAAVQPLEDSYLPSERTSVAATRTEVQSVLQHLLSGAPDSRQTSGQSSEGSSGVGSAESSGRAPGTGERAGQPLEALQGLDDESFIHTLAQAVNFGPLEKQGLLECDGIAARYDRMLALLRFRLAEAGSSAANEQGTVH